MNFDDSSPKNVDTSLLELRFKRDRQKRFSFLSSFYVPYDNYYSYQKQSQQVNITDNIIYF